MNVEFLIKSTNEVPKQFLVEHLKKCLEKYESSKTQENEEYLIESCCMLLLKREINNIGVEAVIKDVNNLGKLNNFFKNMSN